MRPLRDLCGTTIVVVLAGCTTTTGPISNLRNGEPIIDDRVWLLSAYQTSETRHDDYLPAECDEKKNGVLFPPAAKGEYRINNCIEAMRNLIDRRYQHWVDSLNASVSIGNGLGDTAVIGLNTAGSLLGGAASQILNASSGALVGTKKAFETDVFYNNAVTVLILQMEKDRTCWGSIIEIRLQNNNYQTLKQGFNDLIAYSRAGSFTHALLAIQANVGNQATVNLNSLQAAKSNTVSSNTTAPNPLGGDTVATCGVAAKPPAPTTVTVATIAGETVAMPFTNSADPVDAIIAASTYVTSRTETLNASLKKVEGQLSELQKSIAVTQSASAVSAAATALAAAKKDFDTSLAAIQTQSPSPMDLASAYYSAQLKLAAASNTTQIADLKLALAQAQLNNTAMSNRVVAIEAKFDSDAKGVADTIAKVTEDMQKATQTK